ncbi:glyoxalase [Sphingobacterium suaedae]|uniref:Glyoxalase n=1 Tax=Sphingobacterium suaedae TaxID=1686402 RepID=A0ABW5KCR0_9SPHI
MHNVQAMLAQQRTKLMSGIFITFSGNCKQALMFYQACFGGEVQIESLESPLQGYSEIPVISGSLLSDRITIHGSDLVHNEGRQIGNYMSIFLPCRDDLERNAIIARLAPEYVGIRADEGLALVEVTDPFDVRWVLGI